MSEPGTEAGRRERTKARIVHVVEPSLRHGPIGAMLAAATVVHAIEGEHQVVVLGTRAEVDHARRFGLPVVGSCCPPRAAELLRLGRRSLVAAVATRRPDVVHLWSSRALELLWPSPTATRAVAAVTLIAPGADRRGGAGDVVTLDASQLASGWQDETCRTVGATPPCPGIEDRDAVRARWELDERTLAVGVVEDPPGSADLDAVANVAVGLEASGRRVRIFAPARTRSRPFPYGSRRRLPRTDRQRLIIAEAALEWPWTLAAALDVMLVAKGTMTTPTLLALLAAGGVVLLEDQRLLEGLGVDAACVELADRDHVSAALLSLLDSPRRRATLRVAARGRAAAHDGGPFLGRVRQIYARCVAWRCSGSSSACAAS